MILFIFSIIALILGFILLGVCYDARNISISRHTETEEISVVYEYEGHIWNRPLEMFMSEVDKEKYPNAKQKYRFELHINT